MRGGGCLRDVAFGVQKYLLREVDSGLAEAPEPPSLCLLISCPARFLSHLNGPGKPIHRVSNQLYPNRVTM